MNIEIIRQSRGEFNTHVSFNADGVYHTAIVYGPDDGPGESSVYAFGPEGDECTRTYRIDSPEMLAAVISAIS